MIHEMVRAVAEDKRGRIVEIVTGRDYQHAVVVSFTPGAMRADHYHPQSTQMSYVLRGMLRVYTKANGSDRIEAMNLGAGSLITHEPGDAHSFVALEESEMLCLSAGPRGGDGFEGDTVRLGFGALQTQYQTQVDR